MGAILIVSQETSAAFLREDTGAWIQGLIPAYHLHRACVPETRLPFNIKRTLEKGLITYNLQVPKPLVNPNVVGEGEVTETPPLWPVSSSEKTFVESFEASLRTGPEDTHRPLRSKLRGR